MGFLKRVAELTPHIANEPIGKRIKVAIEIQNKTKKPKKKQNFRVTDPSFMRVME